MSNELIETGTLTETGIAEDVTEDLALIATNPADMATAQQRLSAWFASKIGILQSDLKEAEDARNIAVAQKWSVASTLKRQAAVLSDRIDFYEKCKAATDAGYCLVPNFPVDVFAIRTTRKNPERMKGSWSKDRSQHSEGPAIGEGQYRDAMPTEYFSHNESDGTGYDGKPRTKEIYYAHSFRSEIDFPVSVARSEVMTAAAQAMALKVFDEMGVLPERARPKGDPMVVGMIRDPRSTKHNRRFVSFLIAWYVNTKDL